MKKKCGAASMADPLNFMDQSDVGELFPAHFEEFTENCQQRIYKRCSLLTG